MTNTSNRSLIQTTEKIIPANIDQNMTVKSLSQLYEIIKNEDLYLETSDGEGMLPIQAADELVSRNDPSAIQVLIRAASRKETTQFAFEEFLEASIILAKKFSDHLFSDSDKQQDLEYLNVLIQVISECCPQDQRYFKLLLEMLKQGEYHVAPYLEELGNPQALPVLSDAADNFELDKDVIFKNMFLFSIYDAITTLGGKLTPKQKQKKDLASFYRKQFNQKMDKSFSPLTDKMANKIFDTEEKITISQKQKRNDPCLCGSGKKYKKCCLIN